FFSPKRLGTGQFYLVSINDKNGRSYEGSDTYHLHVPPNAPVALYWSVTVYDRATHALLRDQERLSIASTTQGLQKNADGSVDVYCGAKAPGAKESNWVPTRAGRQFELMFRFYGPQKPLFDKSWPLPDFEKVK